MLKIENLSKSFGDKIIYKDINIEFLQERIYAVFGINGAGKSTFLRTIAGIYKQDEGKIFFEDKDIFIDFSYRNDIFYIADEEVFFPRKNIKECIDFYKCFYNSFCEDTFINLQDIFKLSLKDSITTFSKGMKKQAILLILLPFLPKCIILDETFDGVDPLIKVKLKKYLIDLVEEKNICIIVSSHNISDVENFADEFYIMDSNNLNQAFTETEDKYNRVDIILSNDIDINTLSLDILESRKIGRSYSLLLKNSKEHIIKIFNQFNIVDYEISQVSKEEQFLLEVEGR
ncbi:MAG: ATP-binding cassette domain-containing protein [Lachnospirales bacterium]